MHQKRRIINTWDQHLYAWRTALMSVRRNSSEMPGVTSIAASLIVRVAVARIVRIAQFVQFGLYVSGVIFSKI